MSSFAQGFQVGSNASLARRELEAQVKRERSAQNIQLATNANKAIDDSLLAINEIVKNGLATNMSTQDIEIGIKDMVDDAVFTSNQAASKNIQGVRSEQSIRNSVRAALSAPSQSTIQAQELDSLKEQEKAKQDAKPVTTAEVVKGSDIGLTGVDANATFEVKKVGETQTDVNRLSSQSNTNVSVSTGDNSFSKALGKGLGEKTVEIINTGSQAVATLQNAQQMADLLSRDDLQTGATQPFITGIQAISQDLGVDIESVAEATGIELGKLSTKEEFNRLSRQLVIDGFQKFKGNLNQKEIDIAMDAFSNLGTTKEANIDATAALMAASELARQRAIQASSVNTKAAAQALQAETLSGDGQRFKELKKQFKAEMTQQEELPEGIPQGSVFKGEIDGKQFYETADGKVMVID